MHIYVNICGAHTHLCTSCPGQKLGWWGKYATSGLHRKHWQILSKPGPCLSITTTPWMRGYPRNEPQAGINCSPGDHLKMGLFIIVKSESHLNFQPWKLDYVTLSTHAVECQGSLKRTQVSISYCGKMPPMWHLGIDQIEREIPTHDSWLLKLLHTSFAMGQRLRGLRSRANTWWPLRMEA